MLSAVKIMSRSPTGISLVPDCHERSTREKYHHNSGDQIAYHESDHDPDHINELCGYFSLGKTAVEAQDGDFDEGSGKYVENFDNEDQFCLNHLVLRGKVCRRGEISVCGGSKTCPDELSNDEELPVIRTSRSF